VFLKVHYEPTDIGQYELLYWLQLPPPHCAANGQGGYTESTGKNPTLEQGFSEHQRAEYSISMHMPEQ
jgi:hypothetical protein